MGSTPSVVSVKFLFGLLLKIGCDRTHKCRYGRDLELSLPPCNASTQSNVSCIWTTNSGHQFVSFPSIDVYTERLQLTEGGSPEDCINACASAPGCLGFRWYMGNCLLAGSLPANSTNTIAGVEGILSLSAEDAAAATGIKPFSILRSCPDDFNTYCFTKDPDASCITANGYTIRCGRGFLGESMPDEQQNANPTTLSGYVERCSATRGCVAVAFRKETNSELGLCAMKSSVYAGIVEPNFVGAYVNDSADGQQANAAA